MIEKILSTVDDTTFGEFIAACHRLNVNKNKLCNTFISDDEGWNDIIVACSSLAVKWQQLSGFLGLSIKTIRAIRGTFPSDNDGSLNEALMQWILQEYNTEKFSLPSWKSLLKAISRVDQPLFEKLAKEHQVKGM